MAGRERMAGADAAWLQMDRPANLMTITAGLRLDRPPAPGALRAAAEALVARHPRLQQRVVPPRFALGATWWEDDPDFSLDRQLERRDLPAPGGDAGLAALIGELAGSPLPQTRPPWRLVWVDDPAAPALLACFHHCLVDSSAAAALVLALADASLAAAVGGGRALTGGVRALSQLAAMPSDSPSVLQGSLGAAKRAAWSAPAPLSTARRVAEVTGASVEAVLLTAVTGALRRYLERRGSLVEAVGVFSPVDLRSGAARLSPGQPGSRIGLVHLSLPVGLHSVHERLAAFRRQGFTPGQLPPAMDPGLLGSASARLERLAVDFLSSRASAVLVDLQGPDQPIRAAGAPALGLLVFPHRAGGYGLGLALVRYAGGAVLCAVSDAGLVPDPEALTADFDQAFAELAALAPDELDDPVTEELPDPDPRCAATTRAGRPCRNRPQAGSAYCHVHRVRDPAPPG